MKQNLFFIGILMLVVAAANGQSTIREVDYDAPATSIVRMHNNVLLTYMETTSGLGSFGCENNSMVTMKQVKLPEGHHVSDFRIPSSSRAYFCGTTGNTGYIGYLRHPDFLSVLTPSYHIYYFQNISMSYNNSVLDNFEPRRMAAYYDNDYHCYVVGTCRQTNTNGESDQVYFIGYWRSNQNFHFIEVLIAPGGVETYDDVALTDNYVVVAGHKNGSNGTFLRLIEKGVSLAFSPISQHLHQVSIGNYSPVFIASLPGDAFALASYSSNQNRIVVNTATFEILPGATPTINVLSSMKTEPEHYGMSTPIQIKEFVHDPVGNRLLLLQEVGDYQNQGWTVGDYPMVGNAIAGISMKQNYSNTPSIELHSIALKGGGHYVGSGARNQVIWLEDGVSGLGPCMHAYTIPMNKKETKVNVDDENMESGVAPTLINTVSNSVVQRWIHTICQ